ncbi:hypothetical protein BKA82DRAFT_4113855, partial [Pisolithus tinctorius]
MYHVLSMGVLMCLTTVNGTPPATPVKIFAVSNALEWSLSAVRDYSRSQMTTQALIQNEFTAWFRSSYMIAEWTVQIVVPNTT